MRKTGRVKERKRREKVVQVSIEGLHVLAHQIIICGYSFCFLLRLRGAGFLGRSVPKKYQDKTRWHAILISTSLGESCRSCIFGAAAGSLSRRIFFFVFFIFGLAKVIFHFEAKIYLWCLFGCDSFRALARRHHRLILQVISIIRWLRVLVKPQNRGQQLPPQQQ